MPAVTSTPCCPCPDMPQHSTIHEPCLICGLNSSTPCSMLFTDCDMLPLHVLWWWQTLLNLTQHDRLVPPVAEACAKSYCQCMKVQCKVLRSTSRRTRVANPAHQCQVGLKLSEVQMRHDLAGFAYIQVALLILDLANANALLKHVKFFFFLTQHTDTLPDSNHMTPMHC